MDRALALGHLEVAAKALLLAALTVEANERSLPDAGVVAQQGEPISACRF